MSADASYESTECEHTVPPSASEEADVLQGPGLEYRPRIPKWSDTRRPEGPYLWEHSVFHCMALQGHSKGIHECEHPTT